MRNSLRYEIVDVFTDKPFAGNSLAVVFDADELETAQLQAIAKEFNLSETAFPMAVDRTAESDREVDYRLRIFTPEIELPFAGHPSIGAAWLMTTRGRIGGGRAGELRFVQRCGAGDLRLAVEVGADGSAGLTRVAGAAPTLGDTVDADLLLAAAGLGREDLAEPAPRPAGAGLAWAFLMVNDEAVARAVPDLGALRGGPPDVMAAGIYVFSWDGSTAHARAFAGEVGVPEDPGTGSAALGLGVYLIAAGLLGADGASSYVVRQGLEMGRPSTMLGRVVAEAGRAVHVEVAGEVQPVARGEIAVPLPPEPPAVSRN